MSPSLLLQRAGSRWAEAMQGQGHAWLFIGKTLLALYLTAWLSMRLELPSPFTAMVTVLIVASPQPGAVLSKAFYRSIGTLIGCSMGVVFVALFPQQPTLLLLAMALWTALMAAASLMNRNFRAYCFVLSGYTVAMIVLPAVDQPEQVFHTAIWRFTEVGLGLIVTSAVFDILWPTRMRTPLLGNAKRNGLQLLQWIEQQSRDPARNGHAEQLALVRAAVSYEDLRSVAYFDDPALRSGNGLLTQLNQRYMSTLSAYDTLHHVRDRLQRHGQTAEAAPITDALVDLADRLQTALATSDNHLILDTLRDWQRQLPTPPAGELGLELGLNQLAHFASSLIEYWHLYVDLDIDQAHRIPRERRQVTQFLRVTDPVAIALAMLRAGGLTFIIGLLWMLSGWQSGASGLFMIVALMSIMSAAPYPMVVFRLVSIGHLSAPILGLVCYSLMPLMNEFIWLVLISTPFMMIILYLVTRPKWMATGMAMNMGFMVALMIAPAPHVDAQWFLNEMVSVSLGVLVVGVGFLLIPNVTHSRGQRRRLQRMLRGQVAKAARWPLHRADERLASRHYDLLTQLLNMTRQHSPAALQLLHWSQLTYEASSAVIALRQQLHKGIATPHKRSLDTLIDQLGQLFLRPDAQQWQRTRTLLTHLISDVQTPELRLPLLQLHTQLNDGANVLTRHAQRSLTRPD